MTISRDQFWKTVVAGLVATYVMTLTGFLQSGLGLSAMDVGAMLAGNMTAAHPDMPYSLAAGNLSHFATGVLMALIWVAFLQQRAPGNWIVQGIAYALVLTLAAVMVVVPLAAGVGIFFTNTPAPGRMLLAATVPHLAYGLSLTLSLQVAGMGATRT